MSRGVIAVAVAAGLVLGTPFVAAAGDHVAHDHGVTGPPTEMDEMEHGSVAPSSPIPDGMVSMPAEHLQIMIDSAPAGATVTAPEAVYVGPIHLDRPVTLVGEGTPILDGGGAGSVLTITAPDVTVRGFSIRGSGRGPVGSPSAVMIEDADRAHVAEVTVRDCYTGITVRGSTDVVLERIHIRGDGLIAGELHAVEPTEHEHETGEVPAPAAKRVRGDGIWLWNADGATVRDTVIERVRDGIYLSYGTGAEVERVRIDDSRYAIHDMYATDLAIRGSVLRGNLSGLVLMYGGPILVETTTVAESGSPSTGFGVLIKDAAGVVVRDNVIADNRIGVHVDDAGRTGADSSLIERNTIAMNQIGALIYPSADAVFTGNGFVENSTQVTMGGQGLTQVRWSADGIGNFWSDYGGFDAQGDGLGDLPYLQSGRMSQLLAEEPLLLALASGPAFRLLSSVEDKWSPTDPVVRDAAPLTSSRGPRTNAAHRGSPVPLWIPGIGLLALSVGLLVRARRPRSRMRRAAA
jgi:nitrous oxidase accessory protein